LKNSPTTSVPLNNAVYLTNTCTVMTAIIIITF